MLEFDFNRKAQTFLYLGYIEPLSYKLDNGYGTMEVRFHSDSSYNQKGFRMIVHFTD